MTHQPPPSECDACGSPRIALTTQSAVYGHDALFPGRRIYYCRACKASVGVHTGTEAPMGYMASPHVRMMRAVIHGKIQHLWLAGALTRAETYSFLDAAIGRVNTGPTGVAWMRDTEVDEAHHFLLDFDVHDFIKQRFREKKKAESRKARTNARIDFSNSESAQYRKKRYKRS